VSTYSSADIDLMVWLGTYGVVGRTQQLQSGVTADQSKTVFSFAQQLVVQHHIRELAYETQCLWQPVTSAWRLKQQNTCITS